MAHKDSITPSIYMTYWSPRTPPTWTQKSPKLALIALGLCQPNYWIQLSFCAADPCGLTNWMLGDGSGPVALHA